MIRATVVEVTKRHLIVLADGGAFRKIKKGKHTCQVGQEIFIPSHSHSVQNRRNIFWNWKTGAVFALAMLLFMFQFTAPFAGQGAYAYVAMDMDPSLELEINENLQVQHIFTYNVQGKHVLDMLHHWQDKNIREVTQSIFEISMKMGYIKPNQEILITTTLSKDVPPSKEKLIKQQVDQVLEKEAQERHMDMTSIFMSTSERKKAKQIGISPGHYAIFVAAKKAGIAITPADVKSHSVQEISEKVGSIRDLLLKSSAKQNLPVSAESPAIEDVNTSLQIMETQPVTLPVPNKDHLSTSGSVQAAKKDSSKDVSKNILVERKAEYKEPPKEKEGNLNFSGTPKTENNPPSKKETSDHPISEDGNKGFEESKPQPDPAENPKTKENDKPENPDKTWTKPPAETDDQEKTVPKKEEGFSVVISIGEDRNWISLNIESETVKPFTEQIGSEPQDQSSNVQMDGQNSSSDEENTNSRSVSKPETAPLLNQHETSKDNVCPSSLSNTERFVDSHNNEAEKADSALQPAS